MGTKEKKVKKPNPDKIGAGPFWAWNARGASVGVQTVLIGYLMIYCTNALGMKASLVSIILMICKLTDGVTDLVAGVIVDKTNTKLGRGRPYELCILGLWAATWLCFSVPTGFATLAKCVWIAVCYIMAQSIFMTFLNANGTVYMIRAFNNNNKYIKLSSVGGMITTFVVVIFNVIFPQFEEKILNDAAGWSRLVAFVAVPMVIIGLMRFLFVKEVYNVEVQTANKVTLKDALTVLKTNKSIYTVALVMLVTNIVGNMGVTQYYFLYIVGDLTMSGVLSAFSILCMLTLPLYPILLKHMTVSQLIRRFQFFYIAFGIVAWIAGGNVILLLVAGLLSGTAALAASYMSGLLIIDCADYNEWKGIQRMEGTLNCVTGFANKIGAALGTVVLGFLLDASGFDGTADVQPDSAILMIRIVYAVLPAVFGLLTYLVLRTWKLDKLKPQMQADLAKSRAAAAAAEGASAEPLPDASAPALDVPETDVTVPEDAHEAEVVSEKKE